MYKNLDSKNIYKFKIKIAFGSKGMRFLLGQYKPNGWLARIVASFSLKIDFYSNNDFKIYSFNLCFRE